MYEVNSIVFAVVVFFAMASMVEIGHRFGKRRGPANEAVKAHANTVQGSMLGILALLIGFLFSLALARFDARSRGLVDEANAIGTAWQRAQSLPHEPRARARELLRNYVDARADSATVGMDRDEERRERVAKATRMHGELWACVQQALLADPNPATSGLFSQSIEQVADSCTRREAELERHVPETILYLVIGAFLVTAWVLGYSTGLAGHRPITATYVLVGMIVLLTLLIIDLDRPRRGIIRVDQSALFDVQAQIAAAMPRVGR